MTEMQDFITKLAEGYSTQSRTTNRFWLVLIVASIIALVGHIDETNLIELPFTLGKVDPTDFYTISIVLISAVVIVFSAAMIQTVRTRMLIQKAIEGLKENERYIGKIHIQDYFDSIVSPTYGRVAPISQFMLGKYQFFGQGKQSRSIRILGTVLYIFLKLTTYTFFYVIPVLAIRKSWPKKGGSLSNATINIPSFFLIGLVILAAISMLILFIGDLKYIIKVSRNILR